MVFQLDDCIPVANHIIENIIILCRYTFFIYLPDSFKHDLSQPYYGHIRPYMYGWWRVTPNHRPVTVPKQVQTKRYSDGDRNTGPYLRLVRATVDSPKSNRPFMKTFNWSLEIAQMRCRAENSFPLGYRSRQILMDIPSLFRGGGCILLYYLVSFL